MQLFVVDFSPNYKQIFLGDANNYQFADVNQCSFSFSFVFVFVVVSIFVDVVCSDNMLLGMRLWQQKITALGGIPCGNRSMTPTVCFFACFLFGFVCLRVFACVG